MDDLSQDLQKALPDRYTVEGELRRGGMSTVFLATEHHPKRRVAIKVLDPDLTARLGRERFLREVDVVSRLTHPHILPIFAAGDANGLLYYTMPYIEGESLRDRISREIHLPLNVVIRIAHQVSDALDYAHRQGIIHRDIKPENILLHRGHTFVADFGIARALAAAGKDALTETGIALGTPQYMCPEQAAAESDIDGRADIYSLGCVIYEMLVGEAPFRGPTAQITLARHSVDPVPPLRTARPTVPPHLERTVMKALAKTPADRFPDAAQLSQALVDAAEGMVDWPTPESTVPTRVDKVPLHGHMITRRRKRLGAIALAALVTAVIAWQLKVRNGVSAAVASGRYTDSVAVLIFENRSSDSTLDHLASGISEEVIGHFSRLPALKVTSRSSVEALVGAGLSDVQVADTLGVQYLIKGWLTSEEGRTLVTSQIIDPAINETIWGEYFRVDTAARFQLREGVSRQISDAFIARTGISRVPGSRHIEHGPGHEAYLAGTRWLTKRTPQGIKQAIASLGDAVQLDPTHAPAYAALSTAYALSVIYRYDIGIDAYGTAALALRFANQALRLDPDYAGGYAARGLVASRAWAPPAVVAADFEKALELDPNEAGGSSWYAQVLARQGKDAAALAQAERAVALDPLSPARRISLAYVAFGLGRYGLAIAAARKAVDLRPELMLPRAVEARALLLAGDARSCVSLELGPHAGIRAVCLYELGQRNEAKTIVDSLERVVRGGGARDSTFTDVVRLEDLATYYAWIGNPVQALQWLTTAYERSPGGVESRTLGSPLYDRVRLDAKFATEIPRIHKSAWARVREASVRPSTP